MRYKVGDKVLIRQWDDMKEEFGLTIGGNINCKNFFSKGMCRFCGRVMTIKGNEDQRYTMREDDGRYSWSDDMIDGRLDMTKSDLENGMICEVRNGSLFLWLNGYLCGINEWVCGTNEDLTYKYSNPDYDIVAVYKPSYKALAAMLNMNSNKTLIWRRQEVKEITVPEIESILGYPIKIIEDKKSTDSSIDETKYASYLSLLQE